MAKGPCHTISCHTISCHTIKGHDARKKVSTIFTLLCEWWLHTCICSKTFKNFCLWTCYAHTFVFFVSLPHCSWQLRGGVASTPHVPTLYALYIHGPFYTIVSLSEIGQIRSLAGYHLKEVPHYCGVILEVDSDASAWVCPQDGTLGPSNPPSPPPIWRHSDVEDFNWNCPRKKRAKSSNHTSQSVSHIYRQFHYQITQSLDIKRRKKGDVLTAISKKLSSWDLNHNLPTQIPKCWPLHYSSWFVNYFFTSHSLEDL